MKTKKQPFRYENSFFVIPHLGIVIPLLGFVIPHLGIVIPHLLRDLFVGSHEVIQGDPGQSLRDFRDDEGVWDLFVGSHEVIQRGPGQSLCDFRDDAIYRFPG